MKVIGGSFNEEAKPYASLEKLDQYVYKVVFDTIPEHQKSDAGVPSGCSSYLQNGKLYRNFDWDYSNLLSFYIECPEFKGMAISPGLTDSDIDDELIGQLPYRLVDGKNKYNIMISTHVLFNDWEWVGHGSTPLYMIPYIILSRVKTLDNLSGQLSDILSDLYPTQTLTDNEYLLHFFVTDGTRAYCIAPPESNSGSYVVIDISSNPKLSNFRWINKATVTRQELQTRPTGVERWNLMPCPLSELRFTKAYEQPNRLSEFIGLRRTTKDSTDEELESIYEAARAIYLDRERDGTTWQTMHSVVYSGTDIEELYVQENWTKNYAENWKRRTKRMVTYETNYFEPEKHICHTRGSRIIGVNGEILEEDEFPKCVGENSDHMILNIDQDSGNIISADMYFYVNEEWRKVVTE